MLEVAHAFPEAIRVSQKIDDKLKRVNTNQKERWSKCNEKAKELGGRLCYIKELRENEDKRIMNKWSVSLHKGRPHASR